MENVGFHVYEEEKCLVKRDSISACDALKLLLPYKVNNHVFAARVFAVKVLCNEDKETCAGLSNRKESMM